MKYAAAALALLAPLAAQAGDMVFTCTGTGPAEANAVLRKIDGQDKGSVTIDGTEVEAAVYPGLDALVFLVIGEGFTLNYSVGTGDGKMSYSGSGSRSGFAQGTCTQG